MTRVFSLLTTLLILTACTSPRAPTMPVAKTSATPGDGQTVAFKKVGDTLPSAMVTGNDLKPVNLADLKGKVRIISVVQSIDTPVCEEQTHELDRCNTQ
jgi:thiol peroxidase